MKRIERTLVLMVAVIFLSGHLSCTENPFGGDKISPGAREIHGKVGLNDGMSPEGVYVWLEGLGIGTKTDASGRFSLVLPPKSALGGGSGVSGVFKLYFYLANYHLATSRVVVRNGEFEYGNADIDRKGELIGTQVLIKFLHIRTVSTPTSIHLDTDEPLKVAVTLQAVSDTVTVVFPRLQEELVARVLLRKSGSGETVVLRTNIYGTTRAGSVQLIDLSLFHLTMSFHLRPLGLPGGEYEVIPYFLIKHESIPEQLLESLGPTIDEPGEGYLEIPFRREESHIRLLDD